VKAHCFDSDLNIHIRKYCRAAKFLRLDLESAIRMQLLSFLFYANDNLTPTQTIITRLVKSPARNNGVFRCVCRIAKRDC
jgi:hypothetical protein